VKAGIRTINEVRMSRGLDPLPGGDRLMVWTGTGYVPITQTAKPAMPAAKLAKFNANHRPGGNPDGGQFAPDGEGGAQSAGDTVVDDSNAFTQYGSKEGTLDEGVYHPGIDPGAVEQAGTYPLPIRPDIFRTGGLSPPWVLDSSHVSEAGGPASLDPKNLNATNPVTPEQRAAYVATILTVLNSPTGPAEAAAYAALNPHPYDNRINPSGSHLPGPIGKGGYTIYDVDSGSKNRGEWRLVVNDATGQGYFTNNHYASFYEIHLYASTP
jgi:hypothetical protein